MALPVGDRVTGIDLREMPGTDPGASEHGFRSGRGDHHRSGGGGGDQQQAEQGALAQQSGAPVAEQRQRDAGHGEEPDHHGQVDHRLKGQRPAGGRASESCCRWTRRRRSAALE